MWALRRKSSEQNPPELHASKASVQWPRAECAFPTPSTGWCSNTRSKTPRQFTRTRLVSRLCARFARDLADRTQSTRRRPASKRGSQNPAHWIATLHTRRGAQTAIAKRAYGVLARTRLRVSETPGLTSSERARVRAASPSQIPIMGCGPLAAPPVQLKLQPVGRAPRPVAAVMSPQKGAQLNCRLCQPQNF
jgi:hypothetical protein